MNVPEKVESGDIVFRALNRMACCSKMRIMGLRITGRGFKQNRKTEKVLIKKFVF